MNLGLKAVCLIILFGLFVSASNHRPPINSDFVSGPWSRIGKREKTSVCDFLYKMDLFNYIDIKLITKCLIKWKSKTFHDK